MTTVKFDKDVRDALMRGVDTLANAVKITLGPKGSNVIIERINEDPHVTKDGVTVAKEFELTDPIENMGATVVKRVAEKSGHEAGDGTTTATVLTQAILKEGMRYVNNGHDANEIKKGIDKAVKVMVEYLNESAIPVPHNSPMIEQIATISANNDEVIGKLVAQAFNSIGKDGAVSVEAGAGFETKINKVDGMQFDRGLVSTYFSTSPTEASVTLRNPMILIVDGKMTTQVQAMAVIEPIIKTGKPLLIIAEDITGEALSTLILNKMRGGHQIAAVKSPGFGDYRKELIKDISAIIGGEIVPEDMVDEITSDFIDQLFGTASSVTVKGLDTIIMGGLRNEKKVEQRIKSIEEKMHDKKTSEFEKEKLEIRKAKLTGGVAVIEVGAKSEFEMKELKDRIDDAKEAVISALEEGVVLGGGVQLLKCKALQINTLENTDEGIGVQIMKKAIESPFRTICQNANVSADVKIVDVLKHGGNYGYDAKRDEFHDMLAVGILDPKKVTRIALESSASVAGTLLTTSCALIKSEN